MTAGPYEALVALAERAALVATLPAQAPHSAVGALERAAGLQLATTAALRVALDRTRAELGAAPARQRAARAYASVA